MDSNILQALYAKFPQIAEKPLQEEIARIGKIMHFRAGQTIMDAGDYVRIIPSKSSLF